MILFPGSDYLHMYIPCTKHSLHIFATVPYRKTTICKGKYCITCYHDDISFGKGIRLKQDDGRVSINSNNLFSYINLRINFFQFIVYCSVYSLSFFFCLSPIWQLNYPSKLVNQWILTIFGMDKCCKDMNFKLWVLHLSTLAS